MKKVAAVILACLLLSAGTVYATDTHLYATWDTFELDMCASAWLIKNFVDKKSRFVFLPAGTIITEGIPFDTPDAELRRTANRSTFENIMTAYHITDPALIAMGNIIHESEINFWGRKVRDESKALNEKIKSIFAQTQDNQRSLKKSFSIFDELYISLQHT
jgi:hypothetical protein